MATRPDAYSIWRQAACSPVRHQENSSRFKANSNPFRNNRSSIDKALHSTILPINTINRETPPPLSNSFSQEKGEEEHVPEIAKWSLYPIVNEQVLPNTAAEKPADILLGSAIMSWWHNPYIFLICGRTTDFWHYLHTQDWLTRL